MYQPCDTNRGSLAALLSIGCFVVVALLLVSWDSYLYDLWPHHDVIWFFMCGKAWMNGMTPYVDFADSKGPLLWLIYGLGYLLRPRDYVGIYWLSCVLYTYIFYISYKCAMLFVRDSKVSLAAVLLSAVFFLSGLTHIEVRAEDYCYAFMLPIFYRFLRHTVGREQSHHFVKSSALTLGVALGGTLLIKYSGTLMLAVFFPYFLFIVPRRCGYSPWRALGWCALAGTLTVLPMIVVLAVQGSLESFIHEYFFVTAGTFSNMRGEAITVSGALSLFLSLRGALFTVGIVAGVALYCARVREDWLFVVVALLWFTGVILLNGTDRIYLNVLALFTVLFAGLVLQPLGHWLKHSITLAVLSVATAGILFASVDHSSLFNNQSVDRKIWYYYPMLMTQYDSPKILYLNCHDHGEGVPVNALPACKYWSLQMGYTPEMVKDQVDAVKSHRCNVVIVYNNDVGNIGLLESNGYYRNDYTTAGLGGKNWIRHLLYSDRPLNPIPATYPSTTEVLLKKSILKQQQ